MTLDTDAWNAAVELVHRLRGDFVPADLLHHTGKSILIGGTVKQRPVVAKVLTDRRQFWRDKFDREIAVYRAFTQAAPPVRVPLLIDADPTTSVVIMERLLGDPLSPDRYPVWPLPAKEVTAVLDAAGALVDWQPTAPTPWEGWDYGDRLDRYRGYELLDEHDHHVLSDLLEQAGATRNFAHGDLLPSNVWFATDQAGHGGQVALLDWEFAGYFLPGFDLALLWVLLRSTPLARDLITGRIAATDPPTRAAFAINQAMALIREIRSHREVPASPWREMRLTALTED
jgi:hypothetical protein